MQGAKNRVLSAHFVFLLGANPSAIAARSREGIPARLGLVVSKRAGNAVVRARIKRLCREVFRCQPGLLPDGVDLVVIARPPEVPTTLAGVQSEWRTIEPILARKARALIEREGL